MTSWRLSFLINPVNSLCTRRLSMQDSIISKLKHNVNKDTLPPKPKKPLNAFMQYFVSVKSKLQKEYPDCTHQDILKKTSEQWLQVDPMIKQDLQKQFSKEYSIYKQKIIDYNNSLTDGQKAVINEEFMKRKHAWEKNQIKQKLSELGKPKRPLTAFFLFMQNKRISKDSQISQKDWMNKIAKEWKDMTVEAKSEYATESKHLLEKYKIEIEKWEQNMIQTECPDRSSMQITESSTENFNIRIQNNIKTGWGTDTTQCTFRNLPDANNDQPYKSIKSLVPYNNKKHLQAVMKCPKNVTRDTFINDVSKSVVQPHSIYIQMYNYFVSAWKKFLLVLKETNKNWKTKCTLNPNGRLRW